MQHVILHILAEVIVSWTVIFFSGAPMSARRQGIGVDLAGILGGTHGKVRRWIGAKWG